MVKNVFLIVILILVSLPVFSQEKEKDSITTYFLIRHAEKDRSDKTNRDPNLTAKGEKRALRWRTLFEQFQIDAVYSTNYKRTLQTALPTAKSKHLTINKYHPFKMDMSQFMLETKGENVLVVGHSNTTPSFVNTLIGKNFYQDIEDTNNANLYIVTITGNQISHVLVKME